MSATGIATRHPPNNFAEALHGVRRSEIIVSMLALVVLGYTLFRNVWPYPQGAAAWLPVGCVVWLLAVVAFVVAKPEIARPSGERLTVEEGLSRTPAATA